MDEAVREAYLATCQRIRKIPPPLQWLLRMLGSIDGNNEIFSKQYDPGTHRDVSNRQEQQSVGNPNGFFQGLPLYKKKNEVRANYLLGWKPTEMKDYLYSLHDKYKDPDDIWTAPNKEYKMKV